MTDEHKKSPKKATRQESHAEIHVEQHVEMTSSSDGLEELEQDLKRVQAEFQNYKRRVESERAEYLALGRSEAVMLLLPLLDNIHRALAYLPDDLSGHAWAGGVQQVGKQADDVLAKMGVEKIPTVGQPFDPNLHEAVVMEEGEGDHEVVVEELQPGYRLGERVLRHAMVKVGRR